MSKIAIIGAGGHMRSAINILKANYSDMFMGIFDDSYQKEANEVICGINVVGKIKDIAEDDRVFLAIGDNEKRREYAKVYQANLIKDNICHISSIIEDYVSIGESNQVFANVYINSAVKLGSNNIINTYALIEHEVEIGNNNHISVGAIICGRVYIGDNCMIGAGATIIDKISICDNVIIGAGTVVVNDIKEGGTYVGVPAIRIK